MAGRDACWVHWAIGGCIKSMAPPSYTGATDSLPKGIETVSYFKTTKVAEWGLEGFMTATGRNEKIFLSKILNLSKFKPVPLDVSLFAKDLYDFYNGVFGEEVTTIAKDQAQSLMNRKVFRGKEQLIVQRQYKHDLENDSVCQNQTITESSAGKLESTQSSLGIPSVPSFTPMSAQSENTLMHTTIIKQEERRRKPQL
ncbi:hypothetical protein BGZ80_007194, partial [Entomortierella chlamydospora]